MSELPVVSPASRALRPAAARRWAVRIGLLLVAAGVAVLLQRTAFAPKPVPVRVVTAERGLVERTVSNSRAGTVKARLRAQLSTEIGGRVLAVPHRKGERVEAGDVVLRLDGSVLEARLAEARRELAVVHAQRTVACAGAEHVAREHARTARLAAEGIVSLDSLDAATTADATAAAGCEAARAAEGQARAAVDTAHRLAGQTVLRAPFAGVVADVRVEVGEYTTPSPPGVPIPPILDLLDPASIYVSAPMDEVDSALIRAGQPARVTVDAYRGRVLAGRVRRVAPYAVDREEQNRTVEIEVDLKVPQDVRLLPGTSADVEVVVLARPGVLRIPTATLLEGEQVLVPAGGRLAARKLQVGINNWDWTEVLSGLHAGDRVVSSLERGEVKAGARVRIEERAAP